MCRSLLVLLFIGCCIGCRPAELDLPEPESPLPEKDPAKETEAALTLGAILNTTIRYGMMSASNPNSCLTVTTSASGNERRIVLDFGSGCTLMENGRTLSGIIEIFHFAGSGGLTATGFASNAGFFRIQNLVIDGVDVELVYSGAGTPDPKFYGSPDNAYAVLFSIDSSTAFRMTYPDGKRIEVIPVYSPQVFVEIEFDQVPELSYEELLQTDYTFRFPANTNSSGSPRVFNDFVSYDATGAQTRQGSFGTDSGTGLTLSPNDCGYFKTGQLMLYQQLNPAFFPPFDNDYGFGKNNYGYEKTNIVDLGGAPAGQPIGGCDAFATICDQNGTNCSTEQIFY